MFLYFTFFSWCWLWINFPAFPKVNFVRHFPTHNYDHKYIFTHTACFFFYFLIQLHTNRNFLQKMNKITSFTEKQKEILRSIKSLKHTYLFQQQSCIHTYSIHMLTCNMDMWSHRSLTASERFHEGLSREWSLQSSHSTVWHPGVQCLLLLSPAGVEKGRIWDQHKEMLGTFSKQRMGLWIPVDKQESQPEARCSPESSSSCSGTVAVQNLSILQSHKGKVFFHFSWCTQTILYPLTIVP